MSNPQGDYSGVDPMLRERAISRPDPGRQIRCRLKRASFLLVEQLDPALPVALGWDGQHLLALQRTVWCLIGNGVENPCSLQEPDLPPTLNLAVRRDDVTISSPADTDVSWSQLPAGGPLGA